MPFVKSCFYKLKTLLIIRTETLTESQFEQYLTFLQMS